MKKLSTIIQMGAVVLIALGLFARCGGAFGGSEKKVLKTVQNCVFPMYDEYRTVDENIKQYSQIVCRDFKNKNEWNIEKNKDGSYQVTVHVTANDEPEYILYSNLPVGNVRDRQLPSGETFGTVHDDLLFGFMALKNKYANTNFNLSAIRQMYKKWAEDANFKTSYYSINTYRGNSPFGWKYYQYPFEKSFFTVDSIEFQLGFTVEDKKAKTCQLSENEYSWFRINFTDAYHNYYSVDLAIGDPYTVAEFIFEQESFGRIYKTNDFFSDVLAEMRTASAKETLLSF